MQLNNFFLSFKQYIKHLFHSQIRMKSTDIRSLKRNLKQKLHTDAKRELNDQERKILSDITVKTAEANQNNVTRTEAYMNYYEKYPKIHWAFLAHMVSRNGGWNMTDLKGDLIGSLLSEKDQQSFFSFLERCNWLIFQDAYPQLLLYEESLKHNRNLFHLLPHMNISVFMEVIWNWFWRNEDSKLLSYALIINEQNYIERRVVKNEYYKKQVIGTFPFIAQKTFNMNQVYFPYRRQKEDELRLAGVIVDDFTNVSNRIVVGKKLYNILFQSEVSDSIYQWARRKKHTGSRHDFWPHLFSITKHSVSISEGDLIYSPILVHAWKDVESPEPSGVEDWVKNESVIDLLKTDEPVKEIDLTNEYNIILQMLKTLVIAKKIVQDNPN